MSEMFPQFSLNRLLSELGPTQIQAVLWRLDYRKSEQTSVIPEFDFLTGHTLTDVPESVKVEFLKKLKADYLEFRQNGPPAPAQQRKSLQEQAG